MACLAICRDIAELSITVGSQGYPSISTHFPDTLIIKSGSGLATSLQKFSLSRSQGTIPRNIRYLVQDMVDSRLEKRTHVRRIRAAYLDLHDIMRGREPESDSEEETTGADEDQGGDGGENSNGEEESEEEGGTTMND